jgi:TPP-dependent trihydroxycyclohexane-1,2-dione (THcHDO) dehydratase
VDDQQWVSSHHIHVCYLCWYFCCVTFLMPAAAEAYNKSQGERVCAVMTTSGPGATNLCTGIASAWRDGVPMIIITSQV